MLVPNETEAITELVKRACENIVFVPPLELRLGGGTLDKHAGASPSLRPV